MPQKVLVADDSVTIQKVVGITFANEDISLSFVDNGEEAIQLARQTKPDLIIADVLMPRKTGYEVCEAVKQDPELRHIPVLLLTGTFEPFDAERSARVGADGTITKPFESQVLIRQVHELLARSRPPAVAPTAALETQEDLAFVSDPATAGMGLSREEILPELDEGSLEALDIPFDLAADEDLSDTPISSPSALSEREGEFEFVDEPGEVLDLGETTSSEIASEGSVDLDLDEDPAAEDLGVIPPSQAAETASAGFGAPPDNDVWDLSDFEAVDEAPVENTSAETETLWDDAAAEAIDLVESTSIDVFDEQLLLHDEPEADPVLDRMVREASSAPEVEEPSEFDLAETGSDLSLEEIVEVAQPLTSVDTLPAPVEQLTDEAHFQVDPIVLQPPDASMEDLPEFETAYPEEPAAPASEPEASPIPAVSGTGADAISSLSSDVVRAAVRDAVEKVTWEAFSDLSETVVKAVQEKVEQIAWEVIPQMAEAIIREEIKRLKEESNDKN
jgi:CheY-like chemotaxis protein